MRGRGSGVVGVVAGLVLGVLLASLAMPDHGDTDVVGSGGSSAGVGTFETGETGAASPAGGGEAAPSVGDTGGEASATQASGGEASAPSAGSAPAPGSPVPAGPPEPGAEEPPPAPSVNVRGVTASSIKIGVVYLDLGALKQLGPRFDIGDVRKQWEAVLDRWRREKVVPVHGRDIELVFKTFDPIQSDTQRPACVSMVQDHKVFAVVALMYFPIGSECVAREFDTPLITLDGPTEEVMKRSHPFLFTLSPTEDRILRNWVHWAHANRLLSGKKIGLYRPAAKAGADLVARTVEAELDKLGYDLTAEVAQEGPASDALAVQRFKSAGVDLVMLAVAGKSGFLQQADTQGYKPKYIDSDYQFGTGDTTASTYSPDQWDGTPGMTTRREGEFNAGAKPDPSQEACLANYERFAGEKLERKNTGETHYALTTCDEADVLMHALQTAGPALDHARFVAALETINGMPLRRVPSISFTPTKHHGSEQQRTVVWRKSCACWHAQGRFAPLWVR